MRGARVTTIDNVYLTRMFEPQARIICVCGHLMDQIARHREGALRW
jgi:hypothetical protein